MLTTSGFVEGENGVTFVLLLVRMTDWGLGVGGGTATHQCDVE